MVGRVGRTRFIEKSFLSAFSLIKDNIIDLYVGAICIGNIIIYYKSIKFNIYCYKNSIKNDQVVLKNTDCGGCEGGRKRKKTN